MVTQACERDNLTRSESPKDGKRKENTIDNWGSFFNIVWFIFLLLLFVPLLHKRLFEQAKEMGLPVSDRMPQEIYGLMDPYPQATQR
jgi:hypothetical protein